MEKTCSLIAEAAANGAQIIGFPELWIPGYPVFIYAHKANVIYDYCRKYYRNAIDVNSQHMQTIRAAARDAKIMVVLGIAERDRGSLYMAQTFIGPDGNILLHRRKFKPTSFERVVFGDAVSFLSSSVHEYLLCFWAESRSRLVWRLYYQRGPNTYRPCWRFAVF